MEGRSEHFRLGAVTHQHMLAMGNAEKMESLHGFLTQAAYRQGKRSLGAKGAKATAYSAHQVGKAMDAMRPVHTETFGGRMQQVNDMWQ